MSIGLFRRRRGGSRPTQKKNIAPRNLTIEPLEIRQLLTAVTWTGAADGTSWGVAGNWNTDTVPGASDQVTINLSGNPTITFSGGSSVASLTCSDTLSITGGTLEVTGSSTISGALSMTGGALEASGTGVTFSVSGTTSISAGNLFASGGASLSLPNLTSYSNPNQYDGTTIEATGANSTLTLAGLTGLTGTDNSSLAIEALAGGQVQMANLTTVTSYGVGFTADASGSTLNISALTGLTGYQDSLTQSNSGTLEDANVATLTTGYLSLSSGTVTLSKLTDIDATNVTVSGGASLSLPKVTGYNNTNSYYGTNLEATGTGSTLTLAGLTGFIGTTDSTVNVEALAGANVAGRADQCHQ